jgi:methyltransferase
MTFLGADSRVLYTLLIAGVAAQRLVELRLARRHQRALEARGAVEVAPRHYRAMVLLHGAFLVACPLEVWWLRRPFLPALAAAMAALLVAAQALRYWAIATLGERWTTRIVCLPGMPPVSAGPYRFLRHPNYLAVAVEMAALPLLHGAWLTAAVFSAADAAVLTVRIRAEESALARYSGVARWRGGGRRDKTPIEEGAGASPSPPEGWEGERGDAGGDPIDALSRAREAHRSAGSVSRDRCRRLD